MFHSRRKQDIKETKFKSVKRVIIERILDYRSKLQIYMV